MSSVPEIFDTLSYGPAPEDARAVREWLAAHADGFRLFIGGQWRPSHGAQSADSVPESGERRGSLEPHAELRSRRR